MSILANLDLLSVGIVVASTVILGFTVYFQERKSITNKAFFFFSIATVFWGVLTFIEHHVASNLGLWSLRIALFFAVWQSYALFLFFLVFPEKIHIFSSIHRYLIIPIVAMTSLLAITPYVLNHVTHVASNGRITAIANGSGLPLFGVVSVALVVSGLIIFFRKMRAVSGANKKIYINIQIGTFLTFFLIIIFNFILPAFFNNAYFVVFSSLFVFPFIAFTSYTILRDHLFDIKVITTAILIFVLSIVSFIDVIFSNTFYLILFRSSIFVLVLVFGIILIRGVLKEVKQREEIQKLVKELQETNRRQEGLIHFIGHEVKGFLTKAQGVFSLLADGDLGSLPETMKSFVDRALIDTEDGVTSVSDILKASNLKKGTTTFERESFNLKELIADSVEKVQQLAEKKGLKISFTAEDDDYQMTGDKSEIGDHILRNLIDNSINYTPSGSIDISLKRGKEKFIFIVKDTGIGITDEDKKRLFTEGGHGANSQKINVHSTGYGLFIAKQVAEAHGGTIHAESAGANKGSTFVVEIPIASPISTS